MFVYIIINYANSKIYIGKTITSDLKKYLDGKVWEAINRPPKYSHLFAAIRKYGREHFHIFPLISSLKTDTELLFWERVLIAEYDSQNPSVGYNIRSGGEGGTGMRHSTETRAKIAENSRQMWARPGHKEAFSASQMGHEVSDQTITKIKIARALQDETLRIEGCRHYAATHPEAIAARLTRDMKVLGGKAGSREAKQRAGRIAAASLPKAQHVRWHEKRGLVKEDCSFCNPK